MTSLYSLQKRLPLNSMRYSYPLQLRFKILAFAPRIMVTDNTGNQILYSEQKVFALREAIKIYNNEQDKKQVFGIKTHQVLDFGAQYFFYLGTDETTPIGSIKEQGLKTLFKATYTILDKTDKEKYQIVEMNAWIKVLDGLLNMIPYVGLITGYFLNPKYNVINLQTNKSIMLLSKEPSFWERQFSINILDKSLSEDEESICLLSILMMTQLQKDRG
jgi:hypothetical protein